MKQLMVALSILSLSTVAHAGITVTAAKADKLIDALTGAGAQHHQGREMSQWKVSSVQIEYTARGFVWSQGTLNDEVSGKTLTPIVGVSFAIYGALIDAGVVPSDDATGNVESSTVKAKSITCAQGYNIAAHAAFSQCDIEL